MTFSLRSMFAVLTIMIFGPLASAADLLTPAGLNPGDTFRFIFVTAGTRLPDSTNISDYNTFVQTDAAGYTWNGQAITWNAIGSTPTVNARDNVGGFNTSVPVYLVTGTKVANDLTTSTAGLWSGALLANISTQLDGTTVPANPWTGSSVNGTVGNLPLGGTVSGFSNWGTTSSTSTWINNGGALGNTSGRFFGLSANLTIPVPEPSTYALGLIASGVLAYVARRRKARPDVVRG